MKNYLKKFALFFSVKEKTIDEISQFCEVLSFKKDEIIFFENEKLEHIYGVISGDVILYSVDSKGNIIPKSNLFSGEIFGLISNIQNEPSFLNARALSDVVIVKIEFKKFKKYISYPPFSDRIIKLLTNNIKNHMRLSKLDELDSTKKLAYVLLNFPQRFLHKKKYLLAKELKMTPETLSRVMRKFKNENIINEIEHKIVVVDEEKLKNYLN
jgi:CRP/FNR family transcriptional regulator